MYDANLAIVDRWDGDVVELCDEIDRVQHEHDFGHRKVVVPDEDLAVRLWPGIEQLDWPLRHRSLLMVHSRVPDRPADASIEVLAVGEVELSQAKRALELEVYASDPESSASSSTSTAAWLLPSTCATLAARVDGEIASYAGLYLDDGVAQVEDLATLPAYRRQGPGQSDRASRSCQGKA